MINIKLTSDEFIANLNDLTKKIDMQLVSKGVLHSKMDTIRQYEHDDFMRLLGELNNNELTEPSEWLQAIQSLYHNNEFWFADDAKEMSYKCVSILSVFGKKLGYIESIRKYTFWLLMFVFMIVFFVFYDLPWWKTTVYSFGSAIISMIIIEGILDLTEKRFLHMARDEFLKLIPLNHPHYHGFIKIFYEIESSNNAGKKLSIELKRFSEQNHQIQVDTVNNADNARPKVDEQPETYDSESSNPEPDTSDESVFQSKTLDILEHHKRMEFPDKKLNFWMLFSTLVTCFELFLLYDLTWWGSALSGLLISVLTYGIVVGGIYSTFIYHKRVIKLATTSFLSLFPYNHPQHEEAIKSIQELKGTDWYIDTLLDSISKNSTPQFHKLLQGYDACEGPIGKRLKYIILPYDRAIIRLSTLKTVLTVLYAVIVPICIIDFFELVWWQDILYIVGGFFLYIALWLTAYMFILKNLSNSLLNSFNKSFPENHPDYYIAISMLTQMGPSNLSLKSNPHIQKFTDDFRLADDASSIILNSISEKNYTTGIYFSEQETDWKSARQALENSIDFFEELIDRGYAGKRTELVALAGFHLGLCFLKCWDLSEAIKEFENTQEEYRYLIKQEALTGKLPPLQWEIKIIDMQVIIGTCHGFIGDLHAEKKYLEKCIEEYEIIKKKYIHTRSMTPEYYQHIDESIYKIHAKLGACLLRFNDISGAEQKFIEADIGLRVLPEVTRRANLREDLATLQKYSGLCQLQQNNLYMARESLKASVNGFQDLVNEGQLKFRPQLLSAKTALGDYYATRDEFTAAQEIYEAGVKEYQALIAEGHDELHKELTLMYISLANTMQKSGNFSEAENLYEKALDGLMKLSKKGQVFSGEIRKLIALIQWYNSAKRPGGSDVPEAFETALIGLDWLDNVLTQVSDSGKSDLIENNLELYRLSADFSLQLKQPEQAYLILERSKSRVLVEQMLRERAEPGPHVEENLRTQYRELRERLRLLVNQLDTSVPTGIVDGGTARFSTSTTRTTERRPEQTEQLIQQQQTVEQELAKVRQAIAEQDAAFGEAIQPRPLTTEEVLSLIPANTLVIAFEHRPEFLYLYAITAQGVQAPLQIDLPLQQVETQVETFQDKMRELAIVGGSLSRTRKMVNKLCGWLDSQLKEPFEALTAQFQPRHIIFIPHVVWHLLPIHMVNIDNEPLAVRYPVHYLPSLQILRLIRERPSAKQEKGCIIANPTQDLAGAEKESQTVYQLRGQTDTVLSHQDAGLAAVRDVLDNSQHSHFSCHGSFDQDLNKAGLHLADGLLAAKEIFTSIRMDNPRLVVMSACETAQIKPTLADEYMGLSSSFLFAGAHNVLATLWPIEDNASRLLIENFYQGLNEELSPIKALQQAQQQLRTMSIEAIIACSPGQLIAHSYHSPYYWAGFVLIGDGE